MPTSPESVVDAPPKYSEADLQDDAKRAKVIAEYEAEFAKVPPPASWEIDALVKKGLSDGLFKQNDERADDMFDTLELTARVPNGGEIQGLLANIKNEQEQAKSREEYDRLQTELTPLTHDVQVARMGDMVEEALRRGAFDVTKPVPEQKKVDDRKDRSGKPIPGTGKPYKPGEPARISPRSRSERATARAFDAMMNDPMFSAADRATITARISEVGAHKEDILRDEGTRATRAKAKAEADRQDRLEQARQKIEVADKEQERIDKYGLNQVELKAGTVVENYDVKATKDHWETINGKKRKIKAQVNPLTGELLHDQTVTDQSIVDEARKEMEAHELVQQYGVEGAKKHLEARQRQEELDKTLGKAKKSYEDAHAVWVTFGGAGREPELSDFGPNGQLRVMEVRDNPLTGAKGAETQAWESDYEARALNELYDKYQKQIDAQPDVNFKKRMEVERTEAMKNERARLEAMTGQVAASATEARTHSANREAWNDLGTVTANDPRAEELALARHQALQLDPLPFLEEKQGGLFHWTSKKRGPKVVEAYFRSKDNPNLIVVERRVRRSGELQSQTVITTERPIRNRRGFGKRIPLPPAEVRATVDQVRVQDKAIAVQRTGNRFGARSAGELVSGGNFWGTGGRIDGDNGVYAKQYGATVNQLNAFKYGGRDAKGNTIARRGGLFHAMGIFK